jgi:RimJ/RimL family protein N-acetyltransferase
MVRRLFPREHHLVAEHLLRLSHRHRHLRFCGPVDDAYLTAYSQTMFQSGGVVLGYFASGRLCGLGELHPHHSRTARIAEVAFTVDGALQGNGIGTELLRRLVALAPNLGFDKLHFACLADNLSAQCMARKLGGTLQFIDGTVEAEIVQSMPKRSPIARLKAHPIGDRA